MKAVTKSKRSTLMYWITLSMQISLSWLRAGSKISAFMSIICTICGSPSRRLNCYVFLLDVSPSDLKFRFAFRICVYM